MIDELLWLTLLFTKVGLDRLVAVVGDRQRSFGCACLSGFLMLLPLLLVSEELSLSL